MRGSPEPSADVLVIERGEPGDPAPGWMDGVHEQYEVTVTSDVDDAARTVPSTRPACVVVTGPLPATVDALERLADFAGTTTFLAVVDGTDDDGIDRALAAGADDVLPAGDSEGAARIATNRIAGAVDRRRTEHRATLAHEGHDVLLSEASVPVILVSADGQIARATDGAADYLGYDDVEVLAGTEMQAIVHEDDRERALERFERVVEERESVPEAELRLTTVDGETRYAAVSTTPVYYDGELVAQAVANDVTDRYDPVQSLTRTDSVLPAALNVLQDVLFVIDTDGKLRFWNDALPEKTGYSDEEIGAMEPRDFFAEDDAEEAVAALKEVFETGSGNLEASLLTKDGTEIRCEFRSQAIENDDVDVVGVIGLGRDVRERERRERALRTLNTVGTELKDCETPTAAAERTVAAATGVLDMEFCDVSLVDEDATHLEVAAATEALDEDATMRMSVEEGVAGLTHRSGRSFLVDDLDEFEEVEPKGEFHSLVSVPVGEYGVFQAVARAEGAFDETDLELVELLAGHCATALERIEREATLRERTESLQDQNERLEEFASVVSHDLRNPLTLLQAELEMAEETGDPESFGRVRDAITRMDDLIEDLLSLARAGEGVSETEQVSIESAAIQCWGTVSSVDGSLAVKDAGSVEADPTRFRQLLENLFRNALEHGAVRREDESADEDATAVTVTIGSLADGDGFFVEDDGPGIPEGEREAVFDSGYTTVADGTGFGLRIVEDVVNAHGWTVSVAESDAGGARFEIRT